MNTNIDELNKLNKLVTMSFRRKHIIVLEPEGEHENKGITDDSNIIYDRAQWKVPAKISGLIEELSQNRQLSNEDKILLIYETLCRDYVYDDNIISYIQKLDDDSYALPDWYGRDIDKGWEENREQHNRRVCYEMARYLAKALREVFKDNQDFKICILWDKSLTHYFVALTCKDYSITLDLDNFNNIKDLTRIKAGLTAEGILILEDGEGKFKSALDKFNQGRSKDAIEKVQQDVAKDMVDSSLDTENGRVLFVKYAIEILKNTEGIDSQGLYEYIKEIVDVTLGPQARKKVWKEIKGIGNEGIRYIRCLILDIDNQKYIIDVDKMLLRPFDEQELKKDDREFIPYKELLDEGVRNYRSRTEKRYDGR